jgi:tetratricopeptide (TPR) repeat protein
LDLYLPKPEPSAGPWPVVLFANGVGDPAPRKLKDWEIYRTWARLLAAHGVAAATMEAEAGRTSERIAQAVDYLGREGAALGLDPERIGLWACSGNVTSALPYAMGQGPLRAAVLYYGFAEVTKLRPDLPVFYVMAGKDSPTLNDGIRRLWAAATQQTAPWTMLLAPELPHAFDALVESAGSIGLVKDTVAFLVRALGRPAATPEPSLARRALTHSFGWEWDRAAEAYAAIVAATPRDTEARRQLARALSRTGRAAEAIGELRQAIALGEDGGFVRFELANLLIAEKQYADAVAEYDAALARGWPPGLANYNAACALARLGQLEEAFGRLEQAIVAGFGARSQIETDQDLAPLRGDPRFAALLGRVRR